MSAYIIDPETMDQILSYLQSRQAEYNCLRVTSHEDAQELGDQLYEMNVSAVQQRYPDDLPHELPGPSDWTPAQYRFRAGIPDALDAFDAMSSLQYQCSEGDVPERELFGLLDRAKRDCAVEIARKARDKRERDRDRPAPTVISQEPRSISSRETAKILRRELRQKWPGVKFSVQCGRGTAYSWLDVHMPQDAQVDDNEVRQFVKRFEGRTFNGSTDGYDSNGPAILNGELVRFQTSGINVTRDWQPELAEQ